jgi:hypothetical protein
MRHVVSDRHVTTVGGGGLLMDSCVRRDAAEPRCRQIPAWCARAAIPTTRRSLGEHVTLFGRVALAG